MGDAISRQGILDILMSTKTMAAVQRKAGKLDKKSEDFAVEIIDLFADMIMQMPSVRTSQDWTSVHDELPKFCGSFLVCGSLFRDGTVYMKRHMYADFKPSPDGGRWDVDDGIMITHWMNPPITPPNRGVL